jgi:hypothetical protein
MELAKASAALGCLAQGHHHLVGIGAFVQVARRAQAQGTHGELLVGVGGQHQHRQARVLVLELLEHVQPIAAGHGDVQHDHVQSDTAISLMKATHLAQGVDAIGRIAHHVEVSRIAQHLAQTLPHDVVVVHQQHADHAGATAAMRGSR